MPIFTTVSCLVAMRQQPCCGVATMPRMRTTVIAALTVLSVGFPAHADWMFRRAYVPQSEHDVTTELPARPSRAAYRAAEPQRGPGFSVRGAYRINVYRLQSGTSHDTTFFHEVRVEESAQ